MASGSWLSANGGSGASGAHESQANAVNGNDGSKNTTAQAVGGSTLDGGPGGKGGAQAGAPTDGGAGNTNDDGGGGGGGGYGRIRVNGISACTVGSSVSGALSKNDCCNNPASCTNPAPDTTCTSAQYNGKSYWFCSNARTFAQARNNCMAVGHNLASVESSGENAFIDTNLGTGAGWIGFTDRDEYSDEGYFVWQNGRAVAYTAWNTGEPNNAGGAEDCTEQYNGGAWNDIDCAVTRPYVCEVAGTDHSTSVGENGTANLTCLGRHPRVDGHVR